MEDRPWSEVSIAGVTERAGLTRTAFYKHFDDRRALLLALLDELSTQLAGARDRWQSGDGDGDASPVELLREAVDQLVEVFRVHGRLLQAVAEEAAQDRAVAEAYAQLGARLSAGVADRIARDVAAGHSTVADPEEVATVLVWTNERYLRVRFGRHPLADPARVSAALGEVWVRAVYGT